MPIACTAHARLKDWKALQEFYESTLVARAKACGAQRLGLYRNAHDATRVLLVAEFSEPDGLREFLGIWFDASASWCIGSVNEALWEPLGWSVIP